MKDIHEQTAPHRSAPLYIIYADTVFGKGCNGITIYVSSHRKIIDVNSTLFCLNHNSGKKKQISLPLPFGVNKSKFY